MLSSDIVLYACTYICNLARIKRQDQRYLKFPSIDEIRTQIFVTLKIKIPKQISQQPFQLH